MDEIMAIIIQDNAFRGQVRFKTYPRPANPTNQQIKSPVDKDRVAAAAQKGAADIMAIAYPNGPDPLEATAGTAATATDTTTNLPPTLAAEHLGCGKPHRPASPSFTMNAIEENHPGATPNPLLTVNTGGEGNDNPFNTPTLGTSHQNRPDSQNTIVFEHHIPEADRQINTHLTEIVNQGTTETTATTCEDHPDPERHQLNNPSDTHQYQGMYTNQYHRAYNRNYNHIWESYTDRTLNSCGVKGHIAKHCTKQNLSCQCCHNTTHDTAACRSKPRSSTPMESPSAGSYHPTQSPDQHNTSGHPPAMIHTTQISPPPSENEEWAKLLVTCLEECEYNSREKENKKAYLENIEVYEGTEKQKCLP